MVIWKNGNREFKEKGIRDSRNRLYRSSGKWETVRCEFEKMCNSGKKLASGNGNLANRIRETEGYTINLNPNVRQIWPTYYIFLYVLYTKLFSKLKWHGKKRHTQIQKPTIPYRPDISFIFSFIFFTIPSHSISLYSQGENEHRTQKSLVLLNFHLYISFIVLLYITSYIW